MTEKNYILLCRSIYRKPGKFYPPSKPTGGGARSTILEAIKAIEDNSDYYSGYILWFDEDCDTDENSDLKQKFFQLAQDNNVEALILCSRPCIENWLLCHFEQKKSEDHICSYYKSKLKKYVHDYIKGDKSQIFKYFNRENQVYAINNYGAPQDFKILEEYFCN